ncbi:RimJ/RimL family protein N-acetyltransferase/nitroimidazol reductase NimA-like FMN-containing flavoprotein (pyridoxamine 5'-phosphate oxidase superfamily) [Catenuloplanes nepalensis]|uniref:RimJ/RimL family protein N-acetyltransferase/nitroimidazol reductase NimA-like FMN-containing flavoprotein (Pyridoxamine 5'-phosphate oxidase superfamily) n=1 Tax=Catenuloplanes nepalensis TaxID=587533 RepID=A0ABT9N047_9ACTN|nr:bifunctional pyridoxamine 5'-phosphate oxidase family protein/GNAT family N-acetyltransferase [Catenuloplanes nepalensis]MDP9797029.1 RimJ/RimL family protein N-acetyltransferase/nitroimidazol reductase NimA-like FMN-containing flavoprotein (pyridoxamine 5'-phosphate oxidase superfamily) [Catenuloplanes nepalensis]
MGDGFSPTHRTTAMRDKGRIRYDRDLAYGILDESLEAHMAFVVDGEPRVLPTLIARVGDTLYLHGSTGSRPMLAARGDGLRVCVEATFLDGLVLARSQFNHSANYRSVIAHGTALPVTDVVEKERALTALVEKIAVGRAADSRPGTKRELSQTTVLALPLTEVSAKVRAHGVGEEEPGDETLPHWAGVLPVRRVTGLPEPDEAVTVPVPDYLRPARSAWETPAVLRGEHVILEPLDLVHAADLLASCGDPEIWEHLPVAAPRTLDEMRAYLRNRLAATPTVPWVQRDARTGAVIGTTSYYDIEERHRTVAIGHTYYARSHWRTGANTESKLLLLARAFEELGAVRVTWETDDRNVRSQRAIERLGAVREGVLRRHKRRADGTWRDTVLYSMTADEWPSARSNLRNRLLAHRPEGA